MKVLGTTPFRTTEGMDTWLEVFKKESGFLPHVDIQGMFKVRSIFYQSISELTLPNAELVDLRRWPRQWHSRPPR